MEDASINVANFDGEDKCLFGIFDGHGGSYISKFAAANFKQIFKDNLTSSKNIENSLTQTFVKLDELLKTEEVNNFLKIQIKSSSTDISFDLNKYNENSNKKMITYQNIKNNNSISNDSLSSSQNEESTNISKEKIDLNKYASTNFKEGNFGKERKEKDLVAYFMGTTANVVYIDGNSIYVANVGDSYSVMFKNKVAIKLNTEHKICIPSEEERIYAAGLRVINNRVEGKLNLTRAIGIFLI